ncbi:hypothetical protein LXL04_037370 [Taraxacum kok-saghyz]
MNRYCTHATATDLNRRLHPLSIPPPAVWLCDFIPITRGVWLCDFIPTSSSSAAILKTAKRIQQETTSVSGEVPEEPVVSKSSGLLFEKRLIERHILDYGKCPVTGETLTADDLVPIKTGKHDSACRVIARLKKELDEARTMLAHLERQAPMPAAASTPNASAALTNGKRAAEDDELGPDGKKIRPGISASIMTELTDCNAALSQQRKKRQNKKNKTINFLKLPMVYVLPYGLLKRKQTMKTFGETIDCSIFRNETIHRIELSPAHRAGIPLKIHRHAVSSCGTYARLVDRLETPSRTQREPNSRSNKRSRARTSRKLEIRTHRNVFDSLKLCSDTNFAEAIKINLGSCISVYNHAFAFPELVAIPAT